MGGTAGGHEGVLSHGDRTAQDAQRRAPPCSVVLTKATLAHQPMLGILSDLVRNCFSIRKMGGSGKFLLVHVPRNTVEITV